MQSLTVSLATSAQLPFQAAVQERVVLLKRIEKLDRDLADRAALVKRIEDLEHQLATCATSNYEAGREFACRGPNH